MIGSFEASTDLRVEAVGIRDLQLVARAALHHVGDLGREHALVAGEPLVDHVGDAMRGGAQLGGRARRTSSSRAATASARRRAGSAPRRGRRAGSRSCRSRAPRRCARSSRRSSPPRARWAAGSRPPCSRAGRARCARGRRPRPRSPTAAAAPRPPAGITAMGIWRPPLVVMSIVSWAWAARANRRAPKKSR